MYIRANFQAHARYVRDEPSAAGDVAHDYRYVQAGRDVKLAWLIRLILNLYLVGLASPGAKTNRTLDGEITWRSVAFANYLSRLG